MAILLPKVDTDQIEHDSEREVAHALVETLDDDWVVYHSYPWLQAHQIRGGALHQGEADFVLLHPVFGLYVMEVKGGEIAYENGRGSWTKNRNPMKESPFEQAHRNIFALLDHIEAQSNLNRTRSFNWGYFVCFPDCRFHGSPPPGAQPQIIFQGEDLPFLGDRFQKAIQAWRSGSPRRMDPTTFKTLKNAVMGTFQLIPSLSRALKKEGDSLIRLTEGQKRVMDGLSRNNRVAVEGVAGSGKTLLALHQAQRWAGQGKKTLFLCFNSYLAEDLRGRVQTENLTIKNFHSLAAELCKKAGVEFKVPREPELSEEFWQVDVPVLVGEALQHLPEERFEALVVDEAQDFRSDDWFAISDLLTEEDGPFFYFYDRSQTLFGEDPGLPELGFEYKLTVNCRNTSAIALACGRVIGEEIDTLFTPEGVSPEIKVLKSKDDYQHEVTRLLDQLLRDEKLSPSQIAILHPFKGPPFPSNSLGKHKLTGALATWDKGEAVWCSTIRSFKGLESDVLLLVDLPEVGKRYFHKSDLYVACSRARLRLYVYTQSPALRDTLMEQT